MSIIEVILGLVAVVALVIAFFAHKDHLSFKAEAEKDLAVVKTDATNALIALEARVRALETKAVAPTASGVSSVAAPAAVK